MARRRIAVVADSACDLPADLAASAGIRLVPLRVTFGTDTFLDGVDLSPDAFWQRLEGSAVMPTTASPPPGALLDAYRQAAGQGAEGVVSVHLSSRLSRTADTARLAAADAPLAVEVVDSRSVSMGHGLVALAAARAADAGAGLEEVADAARSAGARLSLAAVLETVEMLKRGGRVGRARAALSGLLRIRPVLSLDEGEPVLVARSRTRSRAVEEVLARTAGPAEAAAVFHSRAPDAAEMAARVDQACGVEPVVGLIGAVTGSHLGPGAVGVAVLRQEAAEGTVD